VWDALWKDHSGVALWELTGVLDAGELGYLVLGKSHTALVDADRLQTILDEALVWTSNVELRRDIQRARTDSSVWLRG
jgi:metal-dependent HD superfamily phosphatase/phosphodiesterase